MSPSARLLMCLAVVAAALRGQDPDRLRTEIAQSQRQLQQVRGDAEALLDARIRYDLGLPLAADLECFKGDGSATTTSIEHQEQELAVADAATAAALARYEKLRRQVEQVQTEAQQHEQRPRSDEEWVTVPVAGSGREAAGGDARGSAVPSGQAARPLPLEPAGMPMPEVAAPAAPVRVVPNLEPIRAQINGTTDHGIVAQALFRAGQALVDRAGLLAAQGQGEAAGQAYDEARQRLQRAVDELAPVAKDKQAAFSDLFHLGKCRELLFRIAERRDGLSPRSDDREYRRREQEVRDPFVAITARDVVVRGSNEQLGPWGRAAQAAMDHFRWMNVNAHYQPKIDLDSITWTGKKQP